MTQLPWDPIAEARDNWRASGWDEAADGMAAVTSVMRVHQLLLSKIDEVLRPFGLSFARFEMLRLLGFTQERSISMTKARDLLQIHPASVTSIVDRLVVDELVRRVAHPEDGRAVLIELTAAGSELVEKATDQLNTEVFENLGFDADELATLTRVLADFRQRAGDFEAPRVPPAPL